MQLKKEIRAIGFDLDGTLYRSVPEMDDRIRTEISKRLLLKIHSLKDLDGARAFFEERYTEVQSGSKILKEAGYENASAVIDECLANADIIDLIRPEPELRRILENLKKKFAIYLLTSSPENLSMQKLERLGISTGCFDRMFFSDNPTGLSKSDGDAFDHAIREIDIDPEYHAYIGDRLKPDILPAKARGMTSIAVWKKIEEADYSIDDIKDIERLDIFKN